MEVILSPLFILFLPARALALTCLMAYRSAHDEDHLVLFLRDDGLDKLLPPEGDEENDRRKDQGDAGGRASSRVPGAWIRRADDLLVVQAAE